jgi:hypothetical protein
MTIKNQKKIEVGYCMSVSTAGVVLLGEYGRRRETAGKGKKGMRNGHDVDEIYVQNEVCHPFCWKHVQVVRWE